MHTISALQSCGAKVELCLAPSSADAIEKIHSDMGLSERVSIKTSILLHSSFFPIGFVLYCLFNKAFLGKKHVFVRTAELSDILSKLKIKHSLEIHDIELLEKENRLDAVIQNYNSGIIECIFPISEVVHHQLITSGGDPSRLFVAPSGVDIDSYASVAPATAPVGRKPRIVYVGTVSNSRGYDIIRFLATKNEFDITVVGRIEGSIQRVDNIHFIPQIPHSETVKYYAAADIVVLPYQSDLQHVRSISPIKLFETMAAGRLAVASDIEPIREVLRHGENGILVGSSDVTAWYLAIVDALKNPATFDAMCTQAKSDSGMYSWKNRAKTIIKALSHS